MSPHPYLRAYMAGITLPCLLLPFLMIGFVTARYLLHVPTPLERVIVFPMAIAPNAWGLWNVIHVARQGRARLSLGAHGAILPFLLAPAAYAVTRLVGFEIPPALAYGFPLAFPVIVAVFYLLWKHLMGFLNELLGIA
jgi:hypothetical protein